MLTFAQQDEDSMGPEALNGAFQLLHTGKMFPKLSERSTKIKKIIIREEKFKTVEISRTSLTKGPECLIVYHLAYAKLQTIGI